MPRPGKPAKRFRYFNSSLEVIRPVLLMYVRFPLILRNVEGLLFESGDRHLSRSGPAAAEQVWAAVCKPVRPADALRPLRRAAQSTRTRVR
jgi:hypothetical protein